MAVETYFATDGSYGDATDGILIVDTTEWTEAHWELIEETSDHYRIMVAHRLNHGYTVEEARV